jgi:hypothetical protein
MPIREAQIDDAVALAGIHVDSWRTTYAGIVPDDYLASLSYGSMSKSGESAWRIGDARTLHSSPRMHRAKSSALPPAGPSAAEIATTAASCMRSTLMWRLSVEESEDDCFTLLSNGCSA